MEFFEWFIEHGCLEGVLRTSVRIGKDDFHLG